jgi:hypothetical protein
MTELTSSYWAKAFARFQKLVGKQRDPVMMLLRAHLYTEAVMEDFIRLRLPHGQVMIEETRLEYHQKVLLVEALGILDARLIAALKALSKVRNAFAHKIDKELSVDDVSQIGASYGKMLKKLKQIDGGSDTKKTLRMLLSYICGRLDEALHDLKTSP